MPLQANELIWLNCKLNTSCPLNSEPGSSAVWVPCRTTWLFKNSRRESKAGQIEGMNAIFRLFQDPADNVTVTIDPLSQRDYVYPIIDNHPSGSFWYHAHKKGSAWFQVGHLILCNESLLFLFQWLWTNQIYKHESS